jgi:hypothetical protein
VERLLADAAPRSVMLLAMPAGRPLFEQVMQKLAENGGKVPDDFK